MRNIFLLIILYLFIVFTDISAQKNDGTQPISFGLTLKSGFTIPTKTMPVFDVQPLVEEDAIFPYPYRYAKMFDVNIDIKKEGNYAVVNEKDTLWFLRIESPGAYSISLNFKKFVLPEGAKMYLYNNDKTMYVGAFTSDNNKPYKTLAIGDFPGDHVIIEYYEPAGSGGKAIIGSVGHAYKDLFSSESLKKSATDDVHIDVNCIEGKDWVLEKHAVAMITFTGGSCSGALLNNVRNDGTPYFLTANHCISTESKANSVIARFNRECLICGGYSQSGDILSGATLIATDTLSDFTLLRLSETPGDKHAVYYAGWNAEEVAPYKAVGIHHPKGGQKKISLDLDSAVSYNYSVPWTDGMVTLPNTHWEVNFDFGYTETGSSGSPLFDQDGHVVGQLHGGSGSDLYGKFSVSWDSGATMSKKLKPHLDPDNTGVTKIGGYKPIQVPYPEVYTSITDACINATVPLQDISVFNPTAWEWSFSPSDVVFVEGTDKNSQNPKVQFNTVTNYNVKLKVTNAEGSDSLTFYSLISAGNTIEVTHLPSALSDICYYSLDGYTLLALGASDYSWDIDTSGMGSFLSFDVVSDDSIVFSYDENLHNTGSIDIPISIIGTHGSCVDTAYVELPVNRQQNDYIEYAIMLEYGTNGPFSNYCASKEEDEPAPPEGSCNTQMTWCLEGGVQNSVWFTFVGPESGIISIDAPGFDDQVAVYEADNFQDILNGDYTLLAANDDYRFVVYSAVIEELTGIVPGKIYWVQIDGSDGGAEGEFTLILSDQRVGVDEEGIITLLSKMDMYPNPAVDIVYIKLNPDNNQFSKQMTITVYDYLGKVVVTKTINNYYREDIEIDISHLNSGVYYIKGVTEQLVECKVLIKK